jgi:hypothetical protein
VQTADERRDRINSAPVRRTRTVADAIDIVRRCEVERRAERAKPIRAAR